MTNRPEDKSGVGETDADETQSTEMLDYFAREGLRKILLITSDLRKVAADHPTLYPDLPAKAAQMEQIAAYIEMGLGEAGYDNSKINRIPRSEYRNPPHDPKIPRTNS